MNNSERNKLEENLYKGLEEEGKTISKPSMQKVVEILGEFGDFTDQEKNWYWDGFAYLFIRSANLEAELDPLLEIVKIDKEVGWYMGSDDLSDYIFAWKCLKIILNEKVTKNKFYFFKKNF